ncbi:dicarboxylate/amino acid:cation symporter [Chromobacterium piscinae]|uniref:Dicarboxylate/amino acid:cation symporter n=1 Tax=Chromobacterium piscinae TaxID=686831 RepID=A0ABV0H822_9NEIS|nr:dicarboxylate/amino acid:cation symporter [Chromobacterium piscinae]MBX9296639.1 dicarboxylate/amino acid:cation symporter [Chromobacterium vaccinii]MBX9347094.1 dicarboxylate/amino acid:cation symporter [Chromobacterium vaccinii]MBX9359552.1 dicarboxylate/amino acid:cation symporter [Chromobacterium vaccinii]MCD4504934.1 dicarboxylate/amino acid:cation symporter [Chromobacterium piscinae]MCD5327672.1 dicarboxylate/amino acid:cation symporter [Chromobacterium piscinae]
MKSKKLTALILVGMLLGILVGYLFRQHAGDDAAAIKSFVDGMSILTDIFLRLIKMIIAPLVISTLVVGIAKMGDAKSVGRIGGKTMGWFICASLASLTLGLIMVNILKPGVALNLPLPDMHADSGIKAGAISLKDFVTHAIPKSVFEAMANNEILQIVIFSVFFGSAMAALGERSKALIDVIDVIAHVMLKVTSYVMNFAPLAVFGAIAATVAKEGLSILGTYGKFMAQFYLSIGILWLLLIAVGVLIVGPRLLHLMGMIKEPLLLSFTTASSEAAYPKTLEQLERFGVSNKIASFVLPMGYSFNLDGSMMYCTFAVIFIAQAYGIDLTLAQEISMLLILMLTSKGMAGVPRASLVVIAATLAQFNIPEAGLLLLLGIDHFLDMGRSATNVVGNSVATAVVAKWEGELKRH